MPLNRRNVTIASRVMIPTYVEFAIVVGLGWIFTPRHVLLATPSLRYADGIVPIQFWGLVFLVIAVVMAAAMVSEYRRGYVTALGALMLWLAVWMLVLIAAALHGQASFSSWVWAYLPVRACWASMLSLEARET